MSSESEEDDYPEPLVIDWEEIDDEERMARRRKRRLENLFQEKEIYLDVYEAADYINETVQEVRELVEDSILHLVPDTPQLLNIEELQIYTLAVAETVEERRQAVLRRVRWEAQELELYPMVLREQLLDNFIQVWGRLAKKFQRDGMNEEAAGVRAIVKQAQARFKEASTTN